MENYGAFIRRLTVQNFLKNDGTLMNYDEFCAQHNIEIGILKFNRLRGLVNSSIFKFRKIELHLKKKIKFRISV